MLNDAGEVSAHFARIAFGTGEAVRLIPDRWYSPRTPKGSRTGETLVNSGTDGIVRMGKRRI